LEARWALQPLTSKHKLSPLPSLLPPSLPCERDSHLQRLLRYPRLVAAPRKLPPVDDYPASLASVLSGWMSAIASSELRSDLFRGRAYRRWSLLCFRCLMPKRRLPIYFILTCAFNALLPPLSLDPVKHHRVCNSRDRFKFSNAAIKSSRELSRNDVMLYSSFSRRRCSYETRPDVAGAIQKIIDGSLPFCINDVV